MIQSNYFLVEPPIFGHIFIISILFLQYIYIYIYTHIIIYILDTDSFLGISIIFHTSTISITFSEKSEKSQAWFQRFLTKRFGAGQVLAFWWDLPGRPPWMDAQLLGKMVGGKIFTGSDRFNMV
jgi:hypothetical protein